MRRSLGGCVVTVAVGLTLGLGAPSALAQSPQRIPLDGVLLAEHNCGVEDIRITGTLLWWQGTNPSGQVMHASGIGLSTGTRYTVTFVSHEVFHYTDPYPRRYSHHSVVGFRIISNGSDVPDYRSKGWSHLFYHPDGTVRDKFEYQEACR